MALRVWLPLNGNLNNQGTGTLNNPFSVSAQTWENGKIGQNLYFNNVASNTITIAELIDKKTLTCTFWYKLKNISTITTWADVINFGVKNISSGSTATYRFEVHNSGLNNTWYGNGVVTDSEGSGSTTTDENVWHHMSMVTDGETVWFYKDGIQYATYSNSTYKNNYAFTGSMRLSDAGMYVTMADVRVYDECLSQKQIKEISKGLIAHYTLSETINNENIACENPLRLNNATSVTYDSETYTYTIESQVGDSSWGYGVRINDVNKCIIPYDNYYRFSFEVWVPTQHQISIDYNNYSNDTSQWNPTGNDNDLTSERLTSTKTIPGGTWTKCIFGSKNANVNNTAHVSIYDVSCIGLVTSSDNNSIIWKIRNFKYELSSEATEWIPYESDWRDSLGVDVSGNGYNTVSSTASNAILSHNDDSPRYSGSTYFNGYTYLRSDWGSMAWFNFDNATISAWMKPTTTPSGWTGSIGFQHDGGVENKTFTISNYDGKFTVHAVNGTTWDEAIISSETLPLNEWSYCVATIQKDNVLNKNILKMYINGVLVKTDIIDYKTATVRSDTCIGIGADFPGSDEKYTGYYSDVRIYATVLSEDDIKKMYQVPIFIDNKENILSYEYQETDGILEWSAYPGQQTDHDGSYTRTIVNDSTIPGGKVMKLTCTTAGTGFYFYDDLWASAIAQMVNGQEYIVSMYVKTNRERTIKMNVECSSLQSQNTWTVGTSYQHLVNTFTYSSTSQYSALTNYATFSVGDEIYMYDLKIEKVSKQLQIYKNGIIDNSTLDENKKIKIYKSKIETNNFIEI